MPSDARTPEQKTSKRQRRPLPKDVARRFGGINGFRKFHRGALYAALYGLKSARHGSAYSGDAILIEQALVRVEEAIEMCSVKNWRSQR